MFRRCLAVVALTGLVFTQGGWSVLADDQPAGAEPVEKVEVKLKDLTLNLPKSWKSAPSNSTMRLATYHIPPVEGDSEPAEMTVFTFPGGGGELSENIKRWVGQFSPEGRTASVTKGMAKAGEKETTYYVAEITGTYQKPKGPPVLRQTVPAPGYRMLGVVIELEQGVYYLKLAGPDATVEAQSAILREAFGAKAEGEEKFEF